MSVCDPNNPNFVYLPHENRQLIESFSWYSKDFTQHTADKDKVRLKVVSVKAGSVSKNNRQYIDEALIKSCNTWVNKPVHVNHDRTKTIGHIELTEYESGQLEHVILIDKQPYVDYFRNSSKEIKGFSLGADYLWNVCSVKGCKQRFVTEEDWQRHMADEHFICNPAKVPHGIIGQEISVVCGDETPGLDTAWQIAETAKDGFNKLVNAVLSEKITQVNIEEPVKDEQDFAEVAKQAVTETEKYDLFKPATELLNNVSEPYRSAWRVVVDVMNHNTALLEKENLKLSTANAPAALSLKETANKQQVELNKLKEQVVTYEAALEVAKSEIKKRDSLVEVNRKLQVENDNLKAKIQPVFKGYSSKLSETKQRNTAYVYTPDTGTS